MRARLSKITERFLLGTLALMFFLPLLLTMVKANYRHFEGMPILGHPWLANRTLQGTTVASPNVKFSWRALANGDFQRSKAARFNEHFPGREALIRWTSEAWFRLFREAASPTSMVVVGPGGELFEKLYLREYCLERTTPAKLSPWVRDLRRLQDACRSAGIGFLVVISPSKVSIMPGKIPRAWRVRYDPRPRGYDQLVELFREHEILFIDGPALLRTEEIAHPPPAPFFPEGGIHWNSRAAWLVGNAILTQWHAQGLPFAPSTLLESRVSQQPEDQDYDLAALLNLARPLSYPVEEVVVERVEKSAAEQRTLAIVGGSFTWEVARYLSLSGHFSDISNHFYYRLDKRRVRNGEVTLMRSPGLPVDFDREIFGADCLLLELNEAGAFSSDQHLTAFLRDALAHLPDPSTPKPPFRSD